LRRSLVIPVLILALAILARGKPAQQAAAPAAAAPAAGVRGAVNVRLKLGGGEKFSGVATIRLLASEDAEVVEGKEDAGGRADFADLAVGKYSVEVNAPGFIPIRHAIEISPDQLTATVFLTMTPESSAAPAGSDSPAVAVLAAITRAEAEEAMHALQRVDAIPAMKPNVACPLPLVLQGVGQRAEELVNSLDRFSATERVEHFAAHADGGLSAPDARSFEYVVVVTRSGEQNFQIDEYRNGDMDPNRFPAGIATTGSAALALIFHPNFVSEFTFTCDGLGESGGRPAWQVDFEQRPDRPNRIRSYVVSRNAYPIPLKGRAMIDAGTFQVLRMESELIKPVANIKLTQERMAIDYALVQFRTEGQQLWLPRSAELYVERNGNRYYRRHTFSNFRVFTVGTEQKVHAPKESYAFTNKSDREIFGVLTVNPIPGGALQEVSITFRIPAGGTVFKAVGPGKDVNFPAEEVDSARFAHNGPPGSVDANAYFVKASTLELVPDTVVPAAQ
jgi:hypothetical protein